MIVRLDKLEANFGLLQISFDDGGSYVVHNVERGFESAFVQVFNVLFEGCDD